MATVMTKESGYLKDFFFKSTRKRLESVRKKSIEEGIYGPVNEGGSAPT